MINKLYSILFSSQAEIDGRQETFKSLKEFGLKVSPPREPELTKLDELRRQLASSWEEQRTRLDHAHQAQMFKEAADQAENWLVTKEAFLNNDDIGVSDGCISCIFPLEKQDIQGRRLCISYNILYFLVISLTLITLMDP